MGDKDTKDIAGFGEKKIRFADSKIQKKDRPEGYWKLMIVDDEEDVHTVTKLTLNNFIYNQKKLKFLHAYSAEEAKQMLEENPDTCVILLDVVMETIDAGLRLTEEIRREYNNPTVRIILRTGQPGEAPEKEVIDRYDINDYKTKTELTAVRLHTIVKSSIRTYEALTGIDQYNRELERMVDERTRALQDAHSEIVRLEKRNAIIATVVTANHELNQPLMVLKGNLQMMEMMLEQNPEKELMMKYVKRMQDAIDRISDILNRFKTFSSFRLEDYADETEMVVFDTDNEDK